METIIFIIISIILFTYFMSFKIISIFLLLILVIIIFFIKKIFKKYNININNFLIQNWINKILLFFICVFYFSFIIFNIYFLPTNPYILWLPTTDVMPYNSFIDILLIVIFILFPFIFLIYIYSKIIIYNKVLKRGYVSKNILLIFIDFLFLLFLFILISFDYYTWFINRFL